MLKLKHIITCFFSILFFLQCKENNRANKIFEKNNEYTICIQPLSKIDSTIVLAVRDSIKLFYPFIKLNERKELPAFAYFEKNKRYRADSLLKFLSNNCNKNELMIGLTDKDISTTKDNIRDWGIMGLGSCPGNSSVASTFRLDKANVKSQLFKVAIHELGHTQGLPHCANKTCFMRHAEGKNPTNEETSFCDSCTAFLKTKNWKL